MLVLTGVITAWTREWESSEGGSLGGGWQSKGNMGPDRLERHEMRTLRDVHSSTLHKDLRVHLGQNMDFRKS